MRLVVPLLLLAVVLAGCGDDSETPQAAPTSELPIGPVNVEYAPGLTETLYLPDERGTVPIVVIVPGGGWMSAEPAPYVALAARLADQGIIAAPAHIRASQDGVVYPVPIEDVLCAVAGAVAEAEDQGFEAGPVVLMGHSSGAHLASLATLAYDDFEPDCADPVVEPDALVGIAGPYDISRIMNLSSALFSAGPEDDPLTWLAANPVVRTDLRTDVPVLLLNGDGDIVVPPAFAEQFAEVLEAAGNPTTLDVVAGADHVSIVAPHIVGDSIAEWVLALDES